MGPNQEAKRLVVIQPRSMPTPPEMEPKAQSAARNQDRPVSSPSIALLSNLTDAEPTEYASPAFLKRARLSYGALFEGDDNASDEDGGTKGGARKRTKFGRKPNEWRYASQSRSPSPEPQHKTPSRTGEAAVEVNLEHSKPSKPQTSDEGVQTMEVDLSPQPTRQHGAPDKPSQVGTEKHEAPPREPSPPKEPPKPSAPSPKQATTLVATDDETARPHSPRTAKAAQLSPATAVTKKVFPLQAKGVGNATSTTRHSNLFGNVASSRNDYDMPRFGRPIHSPVDGSFGLADQVRFGFSHVPETDHPSRPAAPQVMAAQPRTEGVPATTPVSHLAPTLKEPSPVPKYQEMDSYIGPAEQEMEDEARNPFAMATEAPAVETFGEGDQWAMATEDPSYNQVEGGHYGIDALEEGRRITVDEPAIRSDEIDVDKVPPGFASYGVGNMDEIASESEDSEHDIDQSYIPGEDFVENEELEDELDDDVAVDDNDDQTYNSEGEIIEEGDYDQRIYNEPESDSDGLEDEKFMVEDEVYARDNHPDVIDEDDLRNAVADTDDEIGETSQSEDEEDDMDKEEEFGEMGDDETGDRYDEEEGENFDDERSEMLDDGVGHELVEEDDYDEYEDGSRASSRSQASYAHHQAPGRRIPSQAPKQPEVIDLISDSEDEEEDDKGPIGVTYAASRPPTSGLSHSERNDEVVDKQELKVRDGDIDPVLLEAVASGQGALDEETAREAKETAMEEELEADLEQAYEEQVHGEQHIHNHEYGQAQGDNTTSGDINLPTGLPSVVDTQNPPTAVLPGAEDNTPNARKANEVTTSSPGPYISSVDGPGSSPERRVFNAEDSETTDTPAASGDKPKDTDAPPSTAETIKPTKSDNTEQQVPNPQPTNLVSDEDELVADTVPAVAQSTDMMPDQPESNGHGINELSQAEEQEEDVVMEDQAHALSGNQAITEAGSAYQDTRPAQAFEVDSQQVRVSPSSPPPSEPLGQNEPLSDQTKTPENLPSTHLETQASGVFISQPDSIPSSSQSDDMEPAQQQTGFEEDGDNISQTGEDADDTGDEDEDLSVDGAEEQEADDDDMEMSDIDAQVEAQLRVEIEQTTVIEEVVEVVEEVALDIEDSKEDVMQDDVVGQEIRDIMQKDLGELISQDLNQEEAVMDDDAMSEDAEGMEEAQVVQTQDGQDSLQPALKSATELVVEIPTKPLKDMGTVDVADEVNADQDPKASDSRLTEAPKTSSEVVSESRETPGMNDGEGRVEQQTAVKSADVSQDTGGTDAESADVEVLLDTSSRPMTRSQKVQEHEADGQALVDEAGVDIDTRREVGKPGKELATTKKRPKSSRAKEKERVDPSIELARATLNKRGRSKKQADSAESNNTHWHHTRQHSPPGRCSLTPIVDEIIEQDSSVALARAALASPSPRPQSLRSADPKELTKRLRTSLSEYTPLKTVRTSKHRPEHFDVLAIAVLPGSDPQRTKSRDYVMTIHVTDPSISPNHAVKVQLSATHRAYLPAGIQAGQGVMLRNFTTVETSGKDHYGLGATEESSWAVFADDDKTRPEIKPTPISEEDEVEDAVVEYMHDLRAWYAGLDDTVKDKVAKAASA